MKQSTNEWEKDLYKVATVNGLTAEQAIAVKDFISTKDAECEARLKEQRERRKAELENILAADAFVGFTDDEWRGVQKLAAVDLSQLNKE